MPAGVSFTDNHDGTATLSGTPAAGSGGRYQFTITAANGVAPNASQTLTLTVQEQPVITSAASATFKTGQPGSFTVNTTGFPIPAISAGGGSLPPGVNFTDNGNGTATLSGIPAAGSEGTYQFTITAANGVTPVATQTFTLTVGQSPAVTSGASTTFETGQAGSFTVTTTGFPTPSISASGGSLPSGVSFVDNGDGTATLSGTPAAGSGGIYHFTITAANGVGPDASQSFTLRIDQAPAVVSGASTTFMVGQFSSFTVTSTGFPTPSLSAGGASLPPGVSFTDNGNGTATLSGTPAAGGGGTYQFTIIAANGVTPDATRSFTLTVGQPPTPPPTPTPTPAAFGAKTLVSLKLAARRIPAGGPLRVLVRNANGFQVAGKLSGQTENRVSASRPKRVKLGAKSFGVAAHATTTVKLSLPKVLRRELERRQRLTLRLAANVKDPAGHTRTVKRRVTSRLRRR